MLSNFSLYFTILSILDISYIYHLLNIYLFYTYLLFNSIIIDYYYIIELKK
jgi:hypothetical protein